MEKTQPKIFHIHIDAKQMPRELEEYAISELGFTITDFEGHPEGYEHFEPIRHLTLKLDTKELFEAAWSKLENKTNDLEFIGYLEGEYIPIDDFIPYKQYQDIPLPFKVTRRKLDPGNKEDFRQTEFHLTLEKDLSHPDLIKKLLDSGLYGAYIPKDDGVFLVLTMQGYIKDIDPLIDSVRKFIEDSGGACRCTIKEERAISHKLYSIAPDDLPEIADTIEYFN